MIWNDDYINGYVERKKDGTYGGSITIDGINLQGGITAVYFKDDGENYLWLRRKRVLEYDYESQSYKERDARPQFEAYLKKQLDGNTVAYKGTFIFMRFKYNITGVWDKILGNDRQRLNLYIERLPLCDQTIINNINESKKKRK
jgi:hypothetical protein